MSKQYSLSVFFPCYNDAGTIGSMVLLTQKTLKEISSDFEILVVDDGSTDSSLDVLDCLTKDVPELRVIKHEKNKGYGGALRTGFKEARKDLVLYTDGDAQYDVQEFKLLYEAFVASDVDVVNGYKIERNDPFYRIVIGRVYHWTVKLMFGLKIRDVDCDFRLFHRRVLDAITLTQNSGVICVELVKKVQMKGFRFAQVPVHHYCRTYGKSQFFNFKRIACVGIGLIKLWYRLVVLRREV